MTDPVGEMRFAAEHGEVLWLQRLNNDRLVAWLDKATELREDRRDVDDDDGDDTGRDRTALPHLMRATYTDVSIHSGSNIIRFITFLLRLYLYALRFHISS